MLLFQRQGKAIDDAAKDLKKLCDAVVPLCLPYESEEDVVDGLPHKWSVDHEFAIYPADEGVALWSSICGASDANSYSSLSAGVACKSEGRRSLSLDKICPIGSVKVRQGRRIPGLHLCPC